MDEDTALRRAYEEERAVATAAQRENEELAAENAALGQMLSDLDDGLRRYERALEEIANPEVFDADWRQMRRVANKALGGG